jgi:AcrR family transcriptional regulator
MSTTTSARRPGKSAGKPRAGGRSATPRRGRRPGPAPTLDRPAATLDATTRSLVFAAAADEFSTRGFDGASVDAIARAAHVNKAMVYYHFASKLGLYREIVRDMMRAVGTAASDIAVADDTPGHKIERFIGMMADMRVHRPWFPPLMLREMAEGAPRLDPDTLALVRTVFAAFGSILQQGASTGEFRAVHPVLAYMSIMGPLLMNAVRERAAAQPGRQEFPLFVHVDRHALVAHMQQTALRMLAASTKAPKKDRSR